MHDEGIIQFLVEKSPGGLDFYVSVCHNSLYASEMRFVTKRDSDRPPVAMRLTREEAADLLTQLLRAGVTEQQSE